MFKRPSLVLGEYQEHKHIEAVCCKLVWGSPVFTDVFCSLVVG